MAHPDDLLRDARKNLRDAERNLQEVEADLRGNHELLLKTRILIGLANTELATCADPSRRAELIDILASAHDHLRDIEQIGAHSHDLQRSALSAVEHARRVLHDAESPDSGD